MTQKSTTVEYFATSLFLSKTFWVNALAMLVAILSLTEVVDLIPENMMSAYSALVAVINIILRTWSVRPVAVMSPGEVRPVEVRKLEATQSGK